jgi:hypothetical protein
MNKHIVKHIVNKHIVSTVNVSGGKVSVRISEVDTGTHGHFVVRFVAWRITHRNLHLHGTRRQCTLYMKRMEKDTN